MKDSLNTGFPQAFGSSPNDFLRRYEHVIYKILYETTRNNPALDIDDLFNDFFVHISQDNFRRLRQYEGKSKPITYLGKIIRNFIYDQLRNKSIRSKRSLISLEEASEGGEIPVSMPDQEDYLDSVRESTIICKALKETFAALSPIEKLIFKTTYLEEGEGDRGSDAQELSELLGVKIRYIYDTNRKARRIFKEKLKEMGLEIF